LRWKKIVCVRSGKTVLKKLQADLGRKLSIFTVSHVLDLAKRLGSVQQVIVSFTPTVQEFDMRTFKENITKLYNEDYNKDQFVDDYELLPLSLKILVDEVCYQHSVLVPSSGVEGPVSRQIASLAYTIWKMKTFL
jgi:hypothetical protein